MTWDSLCASLLFLSVVCGLYAGAAGQVDNGNVITRDEQIFLVVQAGLHCESAIQAKLNHSFELGCPPEWDGLVCWPSAEPASVVALPCPGYIVDFHHEGHVMRWCSENGAWMVSPGRNQTLTDYSKCIKGMQDSREMGMYRRLSIIYTVGYSTSIISDTFALFLLTYFRRLHCTRNYIHMHLFVSFVLRGGSILVRDAILELEITGGLKPDIKNEGTSKLVALPESPNFLQLIACEISVFLYLYFLATNYFWMLVEGLYLHSLIFLTFYSRRQCFLWFFTLIGWGVPLMFMSAWATVRGTLADSRLHRCWDMRTDKAYEWIYEVPILLSIVVNFVLLANIVRVIATKLRQNNTSHRNTSQQNWKLIKSTLALMVLFGTHYVVFLGFEHKEKTMLWKIWMHYELFFSSFQGFFVSFIYCFCNGEVQTEIRRTLTHWQIAHGSLDWKIPWTVAFSIGNFLPSLTSAASSLRSSVAAVGGLLHIEHRHHTSITEASSPVLSQLMTDESFQALPKDIKQLQTKEESIICECGEEEEVKMAHVELTPSEKGDF